MPQAGRHRPAPLAERINRARRSGLAVVVTVRPACPSCGDQRLRSHGAHGGVRYLRCRGCGQQLRGIIADQDEVDVRPVGDDVTATARATTPCGRGARGEVCAIDAETLAMATRTLADWRVRLACVRTEKRTGLGLEPQPDDLALLGRAVRCR